MESAASGRQRHFKHAPAGLKRSSARSLPLAARAVDALQINHIFRRPTPFLSEEHLHGGPADGPTNSRRPRKRFTVAWARDLLRPPNPASSYWWHGESTGTATPRSRAGRTWTCRRANGRSNVRLVDSVQKLRHRAGAARHRRRPREPQVVRASCQGHWCVSTVGFKSDQ